MRILRLIGRNIKGIADWKGKAGRKEFFGCLLSFVLVMVVLEAIALALLIYSFVHKGISEYENMSLSLGMVSVVLLFLLMLIFPSMFVRRLNDVGCSRWFVLLLVPPYLNYIGQMFFLTYIYKIGIEDVLNKISGITWLAILLIACRKTKENCE